MKNIIDKKFLQKALDYVSYRKLVDELLLQGKNTGPTQSEQLTEYTRRNVEKMKMIDETFQINPETKKLIISQRQPQTWFVLTEGWCRDAAQIVPILNALAKVNHNIQLKLLLRDDNLELMDQYLTNDNKRSIPKLIAVDSGTWTEIFNWGASAAIQQSKPDEKGILIQNEIGELVTQHIYEKAFV